MSAATAAAVGKPAPARTAAVRARLRLVAPVRSEAPLAPFVVLLFVLLAGGVAGLLTFNTSMQQASFKATALEKQASALHDRQQSLQLDLQNLRDPQHLAVRAKKLGMVRSVNPAFIRLTDGTVVGDPQPASANSWMRINPQPATKPGILNPAPKIVHAKSHLPSGTDQPVQSTTKKHKHGGGR